MAINNTGKNIMLDALGTACTYLSLHSASPATLGNEITGGSPAYQRKAVTWNAASNGSKTISNSPVFDVKGGDTVVCVGFCTAITAGTIHADDDVTPESFGGQGTLTVTAGTVALT